MDQGVAATLAGIAGLIGAGIGGLATAYGARIGAQKTLEAAYAQVDRQTTAEHLHWIREQRRQTYSDFVAAQSSFQIPAISALVRLRTGRPVPEDELLGLRAKSHEVLDTAVRIELWGPEEVIHRAHQLRGVVGDWQGLLLGWTRAIQSSRTSDIPDLERRGEQVITEFREASHAFVRAAVQRLQN